jgi:hypothetical protein
MALRWGLLALVGLIGLGLWYASRPALSPPQPAPELTAAEPQVSEAPQDVAHAVDKLAGDPCSGLELLDVEARGDGSPQGVWLRNRETGPSLVRLGGRFSKFTLTRMEAAGPASQSAKLWFGPHPRPCELKVVPGIDLARALPNPPAAAKPALETSPSPPDSPAAQAPAQEVREEETQDRVRNPARLNERRWGRRALGG